MEIKFDNVTFAYDGKEKILDKLTFSINSKKINAIVGNNNQEKTALMELISELERPNSGSITIDSKEVLTVGFVLENPEEQIFNRLVKEELEYALKLKRLSRIEIDARITEAMLMVELDISFLNRKIKTLSSGEKRKIAIASVLVLEPQIIIFDNPSGGLDDKSKNNFIKMCQILRNDYQKMIIISSHDTDFLFKFVDHIFVLNKKKIVCEGNKMAVFTNVEDLKKWRIKVPNMIELVDYINKTKNKKLPFRDQVNDILKDVYRYVK